MKDLIIIGAGPAGLSASIYGKRAGLDLVLIEKFSPGGQIINTHEVENYPGFENPIAGWELVSRFEAQARRLEVDIQNGEIERVEKTADGFTVIKSDGTEIQTKTVIAASGSALRKLNISGEDIFTGRGVSYCATCDAAFYKDKVTAVIGGGDVALEEAHYLTRFAKKVYLIHRRDAFRGVQILQDRVNNDPKIEKKCKFTVDSINGENSVSSVTMSHVETGEKEELAVDGVFIFIGYNPITGYLDKSVLNEKKEVMVDLKMKTAIPGLYAAGDLRCKSQRQVVTAAADGATAALSAYEYITSL